MKFLDLINMQARIPNLTTFVHFSPRRDSDRSEKKEITRQTGLEFTYDANVTVLSVTVQPPITVLTAENEMGVICISVHVD